MPPARIEDRGETVKYALPYPSRSTMNSVLKWLGAAALSCVLAGSLALAQPVEGAPQPGQAWPSMAVQDQHGEPWTLRPETRAVLVAVSRRASDLALTVLSSQPEGFLDARRVQYLADMSRMPGFITRAVALPSLRAQPFRVGVVLEEGRLAGWVPNAEQLTLFELEQGRVMAVRPLPDEAALREVLELPPPSAQ